MLSDETGLVMFVCVGTSAIVERATDGLAGVFGHPPGVLFVSKVEVMRSHYFGATL